MTKRKFKQELLQPGAIFYADLGEAISDNEMGGVRPVIVVRVLPKTRSVIVACIQLDDGEKMEIKMEIGTETNGIRGLPSRVFVDCEYIRTIDQVRLKDYLGKFENVEAKFPFKKIRQPLNLLC